jgi:hypothetical protein
MVGVGYEGTAMRLRQYPLSPRKAWLKCVGRELVMRLPQYFRAEWRVPMATIGVVDLGSDSALGLADVVEATAFRRALRYPYLFTTSAKIARNTLLLFEEPRGSGRPGRTW